MKKNFFLISFTLFLSTHLFSQFATTNGETTTSDKVGIGTTTPNSKLDVFGGIKSSSDASRYIRLLSQSDGNSSINFQGGDSNSRIGFQIDGISKMSIKDNGYIGIGTTSPDSKFHVRDGATSFSWTPSTGTVGIFESSISNRAFVTILGKSTGQSELWLGDESRQNSGRIRYEHDTEGLEFWTDGNNRMTLDNNGNVGIGTTNPSARLDISSTSIPGMIVKSNIDPAYIESSNTGFGGTTLSVYSARSSPGTNPLLLVGSATNPSAFEIESGGNVGIGTTTPDSKLTVAGKIHSQEVKVTVNAGADFVFDPKYQLRTLEQTEEFIKSNKHLPEIASEKEMLENGLEVGKMNIKLLQKIEELTLYMIEMNKKVEAQNERIEQLETENTKLKAGQ